GIVAERGQHGTTKTDVEIGSPIRFLGAELKATYGLVHLAGALCLGGALRWCSEKPVRRRRPRPGVRALGATRQSVRLRIARPEGVEGTPVVGAGIGGR